MYSAYQRVNALSSLLSSCLLALLAAIALSSFVFPSNTSGSVQLEPLKVYDAFVRLAVPIISFVMAQETSILDDAMLLVFSICSRLSASVHSAASVYFPPPFQLVRVLISFSPILQPIWSIWKNVFPRMGVCAVRYRLRYTPSFSVLVDLGTQHTPHVLSSDWALDLTSLFHWNTKQLSVYLAAEYTNSRGVRYSIAGVKERVGLLLIL